MGSFIYIPALRPLNTVAPAITGNTYVGQTLTCSNGTWSNFPTSYSYQWYRGTTPIGTNANTYTQVSADASQNISCVVTGINVAGSQTATSNTSYCYTSEFWAVIAFATAQAYTLPTTAQLQKFDAMVGELIAASMWTIMDRFWFPANNGSSNFGRINWMNPTTGTLLSLVNSPTWTSNIGYVGNGSSSYIDTQFNPATQGVNYTLNNAGRYCYVTYRMAEGTTYTIDGNAVTNENQMRMAITSNANNINSGTGGLSASVNTRTIDFHAITRTSSLAVTRTTDVIQLGTTTSTTISSNNQWFLRGGGSYSQIGIGFYAMGSAISDANLPTYRSIIKRYINNL